MILIIIPIFVSSVFSFNTTVAIFNHLNTATQTYVVTDDVERKTSTQKTIHYTTLEEVCAQVNITKVNCSCARTPSLCPFLPSRSEYNTSYQYNLGLSQLYASVALTTSVVGIIGNAAVMLVSYKHRNDLPLYKKHITELSLVDFIFSIVQIVDVFRLYWKVEWIYGIVMCKLLRSCLVLGSLLTIGFIMVIALERFFGILYPLKSKTKEINIFIGLHITVAIATIIPYFISLKIDDGSKRCVERWKGGRNASLVYQWFLAIFYFFIPVCATSLLYIKIFRHLSKQAQGNQLITCKVMKEKRMNENRRIMYILISIMVAFIAFTLPSRVIWIYGETRGFDTDTRQTYYILVYIAYLTYPFHICVNPVIYSVIDRKWRKELFIILCNSNVPSSKTSRLSEGKNSTTSRLREERTLTRYLSDEKDTIPSHLPEEKPPTTSRL